MLTVTPAIVIDDSEIELAFVHASGPGGQHVNKAATAVQLRFNAAGSPSLPDGVRERLVRLAGRRMTSDGMLVIDARRFRSQDRNRQDAFERLAELVRKAAVPPRPRRTTRPSQNAKQRRLEQKQQRGRVKRMRGRVAPGDE
jgi:ribosome-associated protein